MSLCKTTECMVNHNLVWVLENWNLTSVDFDTIDLLLTTWWTWNTTWIPFFYDSSLLLSLTCRSHMAEHGGMVFSKWTGGIMGVVRHSVFLTSSRLVISMFTCSPGECVILKKVECCKDQYKVRYYLQSPLMVGKHSRAISDYIIVCGWHCYLLQFLEHCHHRTLASWCYKQSHGGFWRMDFPSPQIKRFTHLKGLYPYPSLFLSNTVFLPVSVV
jgi:hypothetical protein